MDEDVIVVDDIESEAGPSTSNDAAVPAETFYATPVPEGRALRLRRSVSNMTAPPDAPERTTRSSNQRSKAQPKLKLKLSDKAASQAPGMSFLGAYDRELDSDEEDLAFEEQFILRMPPGEDCEKLRKAIASREVGNDVWFKFKGLRVLKHLASLIG
jgi:transcription initiation factor TFIID subunit 7